MCNGGYDISKTCENCQNKNEYYTLNYCYEKDCTRNKTHVDRWEPRERGD